MGLVLGSPALCSNLIQDGSKACVLPRRRSELLKPVLSPPHTHTPASQSWEGLGSGLPLLPAARSPIPV